jgi:hypothetical protein
MEAGEPLSLCNDKGGGRRRKLQWVCTLPLESVTDDPYPLAIFMTGPAFQELVLEV